MLPIFAFLFSLFSLFSSPESSPNLDPADLSPQTLEIIHAYRKTRIPVLPDPDGWDKLDSPCSAAPGRLHIPRKLIINKSRTTLYIVNAFSDTLSRYPVCASKNRGQKHSADDWRTPEGTFKIYGVYNSSDWTYKDTDQKCYGPFFVALWTPPFYGIGIHGTDSPSSVPGRRSHGCIRMHDDDIRRIRGMVCKDTRVTILPDPVQDPEP